MAQITRKDLESWWDEATTLLDAQTSPLSRAIITEALEGGGDGVTADADAAIQALDRLNEDIGQLSAKIFDATINA